ncbi:MAG: adenylate/guanylate cyclase domain-containing protein [Myxococcota bacterium]
MGTATRTRTVVFTDLANYTAKVSRSDREGLRRILQEHEDLVRPIASQYGGRIVKNLGDAFLILFTAATDALRACLDIQHKVTADGGMPLRLSLATGDIEEIDGDAFGEAVNLSARINSKAPAGEIWFSQGTWICMNAAEIPWEPVGRFHLKGLPGAQEVFRAVPNHRCWLPEPIKLAERRGSLVRLERGQGVGTLPADPVVLFEGFAPGSAALDAAVDRLPVLNPANLWLVAYNISYQDRILWTEAGRGLVVGTPKAVEESLHETARASQRSTGSDTIVLDVGGAADLELVMGGLALPAVPLSDVVASYFYDLLPDGRWVNRSDRAVARVEVDSQGARILPMAPGVQVNSRPVSAGQPIRLKDGDTCTTGTGSHTFRSGANLGAAAYCGLLLSDTEMRLGVNAGQAAELGREPNHPGLALPDRRGQDNIRWCSGQRAARARSGGFTLDRALAGRRQASIVMDGGQVSVTSLHDRCPTWILRADTGAFDRGEVSQPMAVDLADLVVTGTTVVALRIPED